MAKLKISELVVATTPNQSDLLYLVQSGTSKSITVANLHANLATTSYVGNTTISISALKALVANTATYGDFITAIANL